MTPTPSYSAEERRAQIVATATCLFAKKGFAGTTTAALAKACGVSEGLIYKHFSSKQALYEAIVSDKLATSDPISIDPETDQSLEEVLGGLAREVFARVADDPDFVRLLYYSELQGSEVAHLFQAARGPEALGTLVAYLERGVRRGQIRDDLELLNVAANFFCLAWHSATSLKVFNREQVYPSSNDETAFTTIVSIFAQGLRP